MSFRGGFTPNQFTRPPPPFLPLPSTGTQKWSEPVNLLAPQPETSESASRANPVYQSEEEFAGPKRSRSPRRRRSRSRSRSRSPRRRRRRYSRSRSRSRSRDRRRRSRSRSYEDRERDRYWRRGPIENPPNHTIVIKGLPYYADDDYMWKLLEQQGCVPKDIRILKHRDTGQSRGFGFIEFPDVDEAKRWMDYTKGELPVDDRYTAELQYSLNKSDERLSPGRGLGDWNCAKCSLNNFKKRSQCFKCGLKKEESDALVDEGFTDIGVLPCDTLLFRQLPHRCDSSKIRSALKKVTTLNVVEIHMSSSRKFAFVQMARPKEAAQLFTTLTTLTKLTIDGKDILVSYSKLPLSTILSGGADLSNSAADWKGQIAKVQNEALQRQLGASGSIADSTNAAAAVAQNAIKKAQVMRQVTQQVFVEQLQAQLTAASLLVPGAAMLVNEQAQRMQQHLVAQQVIKSVLHPPTPSVKPQSSAEAAARLGTVHTPFGELPKYPPPDVTQYQYEETSGYYFDPTTGLYYDGKTRYYYNGDSQQWLYWDGSYQTYLPVPDTKKEEEPAAAPVTAESAEETKKREEKEEKLKQAQKIQKDMERWAKQQEVGKKKKQSIQTTGAEEVESMTAKPSADLAFSMLEKAKVGGVSSLDEGSDEDQPNVPPQATSVSRIQAEKELMSQEAIIDWDKLACLLCRRQFPSKEVLVKHQQFSNLHKKNLAEKTGITTERQSPEAEEPSSTAAYESFQYRDRAQERRQKYGTLTDEAPAPNFLKQKYLETVVLSSYEEPTASGIKSDNIGNKLLKNMGWKEGSGLGKKGQGIVDPITQERRVKGVGLGASGSVMKGGREGNYKDNLRAALRDRYYELQEPPQQ